MPERIGGLMNMGWDFLLLCGLGGDRRFVSTASGIQNGSAVGVRVMIFSDRLDMPFER